MKQKKPNQKKQHLGSQSKYDRTSINFGKPGEPARVLKEKFVQLNGKQALSKLVRRLMVIYLGQNGENQDVKIQMLKYERLDVGKQIFVLCERRKLLDTELEKHGLKVEDII